MLHYLSNYFAIIAFLKRCQVINRLSPDNFDIACHIATNCALSAEGCPYHPSALPQADMVNPWPIWHTASQYGRQYKNWLAVTSNHNKRKPVTYVVTLIEYCIIVYASLLVYLYLQKASTIRLIHNLHFCLLGRLFTLLHEYIFATFVGFVKHNINVSFMNVNRPQLWRIPLKFILSFHTMIQRDTIKLVSFTNLCLHSIHLKFHPII